jgi:hypothetical protein
MTAYNLLIILIIMIKVVFILLKLTAFYNRVMGIKDTLFSTNVLFWADRVEFIYTFLMAILIIALFRNAVKDGQICIYDKETLFLMYVFGFILLFTADWNEFIAESTIITNIQNMLGIKPKVEVKKESTQEETNVEETQEGDHPPYRSW